MSSTSLLPFRSRQISASLLALGLGIAALAGPAAARDLTIALSSNINTLVTMRSTVDLGSSRSAR